MNPTVETRRQLRGCRGTMHGSRLCRETPFARLLSPSEKFAKEGDQRPSGDARSSLTLRYRSPLRRVSLRRGCLTSCLRRETRLLPRGDAQGTALAQRATSLLLQRCLTKALAQISRLVKDFGITRNHFHDRDSATPMHEQ